MAKPPPNLSAAALHSAGATVVHRSPFDSLDVRVDPPPIPQELIKEWILPFYRLCCPWVSEAEVPLRERYGLVDESLVRRLLACFDWRPRSVGAAFAAIRRDTALTDEIGRLLLRSDVCYAGANYCTALARFNTPAAVDYLERYLGYYLSRPELWFDQQHAMAALQFLDQRNGTGRAAALMPAWRAFVANKPYWDLQSACIRFSDEMGRVESAAKRLQAAAGESGRGAE